MEHLKAWKQKEENLMLKAALLDVDGTLFDTERLYTEGWRYAAKVTGYPLTDQMICAFHGRGAKANKLTFLDWFGQDADYDGARAIRQTYFYDQIEQHGLPLKPGLFEFLNFLKDHGVGICLATGTARSEAQPRWEMGGLAPYIDGAVCGDEVLHSKPEPDIFLKAVQLVGQRPEDCLVVEDSRNGLLAGRKAGCSVYMVPDLDPVTDELKTVCDRIVPDLFSAIEAIREDFPEIL